MKGFFDRLKDFFKVYHTTKLFLILLLIVILILFGIDMIWVKGGLSNPEFVENLLVEAHGVLGDLVIFGVILTIYDTYRNNKEEKKRKELERENKIERLKEEIDDFRGWNADEAKFRIIGSIKRLNKINHWKPYDNIKKPNYINKEGREIIFIPDKLDLTNCFLSNSNIRDIYFVKTDFNFSNMIKCKFINCNIRNSNFYDTDLEGAWFSTNTQVFSNFNLKVRTQISDSTFFNANLKGALFYGVVMKNIHFEKANLNGLVFIFTNLIEGSTPETKKYILENYEILSYIDYHNSISQFHLFKDVSLIYRMQYYEHCNFLIKKEEAEEYKKKNKRLPKE